MGVDLKLIPDHSMIKWKVDLSSISSIVLPTHNDGMVTQHTKYNFKNIPTDFMNTDDTYSEIFSIINKFEVIKQEQKGINDIYNEFCNTVDSEIKKKLSCLHYIYGRHSF